MFPVSRETGTYDARMMESFNALAASKGYHLRLENILPEVLMAGENAGALTEEGAALLDPGGTLRPGIPLCPPEGDAGTGMVATNSVAPGTGNVSAGTSIFAMIVLDKMLKKVYPEIDIVATPSGEPVAMVHCNNCTSELDAWVSLFGEFAEALGVRAGKNEMYELAYKKALEADDGGGKLLAYNYFTGESVTGLESGRPLFVRLPDSRLTLANFMRTQLFTALGALKIGMDLLEGEGIRLGGITGHGGFFKVSGVGQSILASALGTPVTVMRTAGEGGPWGMAILAAYMLNKQPGETLADYLKNRVFADAGGVTAEPDAKIAESFRAFMELYKKGLDIERAAVSVL
jgi:sugar (pentulose or hexulose) kinase